MQGNARSFEFLRTDILRIAQPSGAASLDSVVFPQAKDRLVKGELGCIGVMRYFHAIHFKHSPS